MEVLFITIFFYLKVVSYRIKSNIVFCLRLSIVALVYILGKFALNWLIDCIIFLIRLNVAITCFCRSCQIVNLNVCQIYKIFVQFHFFSLKMPNINKLMVAPNLQLSNWNWRNKKQTFLLLNLCQLWKHTSDENTSRLPAWNIGKNYSHNCEKHLDTWRLWPLFSADFLPVSVFPQITVKLILSPGLTKWILEALGSLSLNCGCGQHC